MQWNQDTTKILEFGEIAHFFLGGIIRLAGERGGPPLQEVAAAASVLVVEWLVLYYLYRKRIFLRV